MVNRTDQPLKIQEVDPAVDEIMEVFNEAAQVHEQALIAMGQQPTAEHSTVASTEVVMNMTSDLSSSKTRR